VTERLIRRYIILNLNLTAVRDDEDAMRMNESVETAGDLFSFSYCTMRDPTPACCTVHTHEHMTGLRVQYVYDYGTSSTHSQVFTLFG
jgi:hypothetical protein